MNSLVQKHEVISIHSAGKICILLDKFHAKNIIIYSEEHY